MVNWKYCLRCGNVVDEFESVCSICRLEPMWEKYRMPEQKFTTGQKVALSILLSFAAIGAASTVYAIVELIALR